MNRQLIKLQLKPTTTFKSKLLAWAQQFEEVMWLDSNRDLSDSKQKYGDFDVVLAIGAEKKIECNYRNAFDKLKTFKAAINDYLFGYLGYDLKNDTEDLKSNKFDGLGFSDI